MTEQHMPGCEALRCTYLHSEKISTPRAGCGWYENEHFNINHKFQPGPCNCELGRLRAENERLEREVESLQTGIHTCHDKCPRPVCVQRREIERLKEQITAMQATTSATEHRLRQAIKNAPCPEHDPSVTFKGYCCCCRCGGGENLCDCWKRDALEAK